MHILGSKRQYKTHMGSISGFERSAVNGILVETSPFLKSVFGSLVVVFGVPVQHGGGVVDADFLAVGGDDSLWVVQEVVCVDNGDADFSILQISMVASKSRPDLLILDKKIEDTAKFIVASLSGHEVVEAGDLIQWWNGAAEVGWDTVSWMTDEESEVELPQDLSWDDSGISRFGSRVVWVRCLGVAIGMAVDTIGTIGIAIGYTVCLSVCANPLLDSLSAERWSNGRWLSLGWDQVVSDILDE